MTYIFIYAALFIAYYVFKFLRAKKKETEVNEKINQRAKNNHQTQTPHKAQKPAPEPVFFEGFGEKYVHPILREDKVISYENAEIQAQVDTTYSKDYKTTKTKKAAHENRFNESVYKPEKQHPILKGLKSNSDLKKSFIYSEIFKTKF